jgi:hypothetical protein
VTVGAAGDELAIEASSGTCADGNVDILPSSSSGLLLDYICGATIIM